MRSFLCYLSVFALILCLFAGCGGEKAPADPVPEDYKGLVVTVPSDAKVNMYTQWEDGIPISPASIYDSQGISYYCYPNLNGRCRCTVSGAGYYTVTTNLIMTQEKNSTKTVIDLSPGKMSGSGWEPSELSVYTQELLDTGFNSDISQWPAYADAFTTPYFTEEHAAHQMTTHAQMEAFLAGLDSDDDHMYLFDNGTSGTYGHSIPAVLFTTEDLSGASTLEDAAGKLSKDKPLILYRAQIHGNEPAAGEAALAVIKLLDSSWGGFLEQVNLCILPRSSPDGAQDFSRTIADKVDPNRDTLRLKTPEVANYVALCQLLEPEVIIDGHEYNASTSSEALTGGDIMVGMGYLTGNTAAFQDMSLQFCQDIFKDISANGLDYRYYSNYTNINNANISRGYAACQGSLFFLLESRGIGCGLTAYPRRIISHVISVESLLETCSQNADALMQTVAAEKQRIIDRGAAYSNDNQISLSTQASNNTALQYDIVKYDQATGLPQTVSSTPKTYNNVVHSRVAPTAYVIPAGESFTEQVLSLMDKHGIAYTFLPEGSQVQLQQYRSGTPVRLTEESTVSFPKGAYVFCRNQAQGMVLSMLMEPDNDDLAEHKGSLVQQGLITATGDTYPIYRYIHDLNTDGSIDYK